MQEWKAWASVSARPVSSSLFFAGLISLHTYPDPLFNPLSSFRESQAKKPPQLDLEKDPSPRTLNSFARPPKPSPPSQLSLPKGPSPLPSNPLTPPLCPSQHPSRPPPSRCRLLVEETRPSPRPTLPVSPLQQQRRTILSRSLNPPLPIRLVNPQLLPRRSSLLRLPHSTRQ